VLNRRTKRSANSAGAIESFVDMYYFRGTRCLFYYVYMFTNPLHSIPLLSIACGPLERPEPIKTHLRNMLILPEMIGSQVAVYNGKVFNIVVITADMVGMYLGEFSITYRPVRHGRPGIGGSNAQRFMPLK